jgi:putative transposase
VPRPPRLVLPHVPLHITQRGVDRCPTFLAADDFAYYRWALCEAAMETHCAVHAYALMTNHVHLLVTPVDCRGPERLMRSLGRRYVRYFNDRYGRTGTLWEGRYRSALVDSSAYLFACMRYIELNPVRAGLVDDPASYEWSSHRHNVFGERDPVVTAHPSYLSLGQDQYSRCATYRALFDAELGRPVVVTIRAALRGRPGLQPTAYRQALAALAAEAHRSEVESGTTRTAPSLTVREFMAVAADP